MIFLSQNIKFLREKNRLTGRNLAKLISRTPTTITDYESGKSIPPLDIILFFCNYFNIDLNSIVLKDLVLEDKQGGKDVKVAEVQYEKIDVIEELYKLRKRMADIEGEIGEIRRKGKF